MDAHGEIVHRAREYAATVPFDACFVIADIDSWEPDDTHWDVIYTSLWMYSTLPDSTSRVAWLKRLASWLQPDGILVISTTPRADPIRALRRHRIAQSIARLSFNTRTPEIGDRFHTGLFWHDLVDDDVVKETLHAGLERIDELPIGGSTPCHFHLLRRKRCNT